MLGVLYAWEGGEIGGWEGWSAAHSNRLDLLYLSINHTQEKEKTQPPTHPPLPHQAVSPCWRCWARITTQNPLPTHLPPHPLQ